MEVFLIFVLSDHLKGNVFLVPNNTSMFSVSGNNELKYYSIFISNCTGKLCNKKKISSC